MSQDDPTMVDVVRAVAESHPEGAGDEAYAILDMIARHQQAEREHAAAIVEHMLTAAQADLLAIRHGVRAAMTTYAWGGTTRQYEETLQGVVDAVRGNHEARAWYNAKIGAAGLGCDLEKIEMFPAYRKMIDKAWGDEA